jgi:hypothetical protein
LNPNTLIKRILKTNKIQVEAVEKVPDEQLELEVKIDKLEESLE